MPLRLSPGDLVQMLVFSCQRQAPGPKLTCPNKVKQPACVSLPHCCLLSSQSSRPECLSSSPCPTYSAPSAPPCPRFVLLLICMLPTIIGMPKMFYFADMVTEETLMQNVRLGDITAAAISSDSLTIMVAKSVKEKCPWDAFSLCLCLMGSTECAILSFSSEGRSSCLLACSGGGGRHKTAQCVI